MKRNTYQAMPSQGKLAKSLNLRIEALLEAIAPFRQETVYYYVVDTVKYRNSHLYQKGSAPNFQGDLITLCSCKHFMRTARDTESWNGVWVAGYTGRSRSREHNLFYLMRTSQAFESHRDLWFSDSIPQKAKNAKAANEDRFGDIYQPRRKLRDPYSYNSYFRPCRRHVHCEPHLWHKDVKYTKGYAGRSPALLVGDPMFSFLWDKPIVSFQPEIGRGFRKEPLSNLFPLLEE